MFIIFNIVTKLFNVNFTNQNFSAKMRENGIHEALKSNKYVRTILINYKELIKTKEDIFKYIVYFLNILLLLRMVDMRQN